MSRLLSHIFEISLSYFLNIERYSKVTIVKENCALNQEQVIIVKLVKDFGERTHCPKMHGKHAPHFFFSAPSSRKVAKLACEKTREIVTHSLRRGPGSPSLRKLQKLVRDERGRKYLVIIVGGSTTGTLYLHSRSSWSEMADPALWTGRSTFPFIGVDIKCNSSWRCFRLGGRPVLDLYLS